MIYQELTQSDFTAAFHRAGRGNQFSHQALIAMYEYLEESGEDIEMDVIGLCCSFSEYTIEEALREYNFDTLEELSDSHMIIAVDGDTILIGE